MTRKELEKKFMEMPELETEPEMTEQELENSKIEGVYQKGFDDGQKHQPEMIHKSMNDINTFQCCEGELYLRGSDEYGRDFQVCFDAYNFLNWIDTKHINYIKKQVIKHIKTK